MASDPEGTAVAGDGSAVVRLAAVLAAAAEAEASVAGGGPTPRELAELLWLAGQLGPGVEPVDRLRDGVTGIQTDQGAPVVVPPQPELPGQGRSPTTGHDGRVPLFVPAPPSAESKGGAGGGPSLLAPAPPMLHQRLALQRALRPLKRTVPSPHARLLDERATADRIARLGAHPEVWLPVLGPAADRWLRLNLVHDTGPTMPVWRPLVRELHTVLAQSGIFRTVTLHSATSDGRARDVPALADGRTVTLVMSDCMGPQWRPGPAGYRWYNTLHHWAGRMPLAVVQPLPERLWATTTLPAEPGLLMAPAAAAATAGLAFTPYDLGAAPRPRSAIPLPVLEPGPAWIANWAALIANPGGGLTSGAAAWLPPAPVLPAEPAPDITSLSPEDLVLHFRTTASPEAFRLAGHLALAVPSVPVMRLVQHTLVRNPRSQHLAEVILSGMLTAVPGPPGSYDFRPGVRELLLRTLPRTARGWTREFLARVGGLIDERAGLAAGEFRAEAGSRGAAGAAFATVSEETIERLGGSEEEAQRLIGGRYRLGGPRGAGRRMREAVDVETDRPVVVHLYPEQAAPHQERFLREARALAEIDDPHVVRVLGYGVEGEAPYLVAEFVDGVTLAELQQGSGPGVPFGLFARLTSQVVTGLHALHARDLVRGQGGMNGLLLRPDGTVVISRFAMGEEAQGRNAASDFRELEQILRELISHVTAPPEYRQLLTQIGNGVLSAEDAALRFATAQDPDSWSFRMLGPLRISLPDEPVITVPIAEAQALLCMLLLKHGRRVTYRELAQGMWEEPPTGREAVRRIDLLAAEVLRRLGPGTLAALSDGYALHAAGAYIDVLHCEELLSGQSEEQDARTRRARIRTALDLWFGDPLDGVPGPAAEATRSRLRTLRLSLSANGAELDLALGDFASAATDLEALLREHPNREDFRGLHTLALKGPNAQRALRDLVMAATVRIHRAGAGYDLDEPGTFLGSGFFVAPNWVLTCAHVARSGVGGEVTVAYETGPGRGMSAVAGVVAAALPEHVERAVQGSWPGPDLALVQLREPVDHDCVYLTERPAAYYGEASVSYSGWTEVGGELRRLTGTSTVQGTLGGWSADAQTRLGGDVLPPGVSGGPVVDPVSGAVVGVLKSQRDRGLGGTFTGVEQLRSLTVLVDEVRAEHDDLYQAVFHAHDRYHRDRQRHPDNDRGTWADVQNQLGARPGRALDPDERTQLLGLLADLPPPVSPRALLDILESLLGGQAAIPHPAPRGWRDGLGALYESPRQDGALELVLDYAMRVLSAERPFVTPGTQRAERALWEWVRQTADGRTGPGYRRRLGRQRIERLQAPQREPSPSDAQAAYLAQGAPHPFVLVELVQLGWEPDRCDWQVSVSRPTGEVVRVEEGERTLLAGLPGALAAPLAEAFRQCDEPGRPAVLQVALPHPLLGLDVDAWQLGPDEPPLGARRPVVMRYADRDQLLDVDQPFGGEDRPLGGGGQVLAEEEHDAHDGHGPG